MLRGPDVWVASEAGTDIIRARDISSVGLDADGNVTARLAGREGTIVTLVAQGQITTNSSPVICTAQLIRVIAQLSGLIGCPPGAAGARRARRLAVDHRAAVGVTRRRQAPHATE